MSLSFPKGRVFKNSIYYFEYSLTSSCRAPNILTPKWCLLIACPALTRRTVYCHEQFFALKLVQSFFTFKLKEQTKRAP